MCSSINRENSVRVRGSRKQCLVKYLKTEHDQTSSQLNYQNKICDGEGGVRERKHQTRPPVYDKGPVLTLESIRSRRRIFQGFTAFRSFVFLADVFRWLGFCMFIDGRYVKAVNWLAKIFFRSCLRIVILKKNNGKLILQDFACV